MKHIRTQWNSVRPVTRPTKTCNKQFPQNWSNWLKIDGKQSRTQSNVIRYDAEFKSFSKANQQTVQERRTCKKKMNMKFRSVISKLMLRTWSRIERMWTKWATWPRATPSWISSTPASRSECGSATPWIDAACSGASCPTPPTPPTCSQRCIKVTAKRGERKRKFEASKSSLVEPVQTQ